MRVNVDERHALRRMAASGPVPMAYDKRMTRTVFLQEGQAKYANENRDVISVLNDKGYNDLLITRIRQRRR